MTLQEKLEILTRLDEEILEAVEEEEVEEEIGHADVFKEKVRMAVFNIEIPQQNPGPLLEALEIGVSVGAERLPQVRTRNRKH